MAELALASRTELEWVRRASLAEQVAEGALQSNERLVLECAELRRAARRNRRALLMASGIAGMLAIALLVALVYWLTK